MRPILELLRLDAEQHRSVRQIAASLGLPRSTVAYYLRRFRHTGLPWPLPAELDEAGHPDGYQYTRFCARDTRWTRRSATGRSCGCSPA